MKKIILILLGFTLFASCQKMSTLQTIPEEPSDKEFSFHGIPKEKALDNLDSYLSFLNQNLTKAGHASIPRVVESVSLISSHNYMTRAEAGDMHCDSLLYLVNFSNDQGYALLAADDRIPSEVVCLAENGSMSQDEFNSSTNIKKRVIYSNYPLDGPGLFKLDNSDTLFLNPNTFQLYDPSVDDDWVGDFIHENPLDLGGSKTQPMDSSITIKPGIRDGLNNACVLYSLGAIDRDTSHDPNIPIGEGGGSPGAGADQNPDYVREEITEEKFMQDMVSPILTFARNWHQEAPFNNGRRKVRRAFSREKRVASCGCVSLAISKILTHLERPASLSYENQNVSWAALKQGDTSSLDFKTSAGTLTKYIADKCITLYFYQGTFTFPSSAKRFLKNIVGLSGVKFSNYSTGAVTNSLDNGNPIFICSVPSKNILDYDLAASHAWNIDGYQKHWKKITTKKYYKGELVDSSVTETSQNPVIMVHCDYGWGGMCNGYYTSGIFDLSSPYVIFDKNSEPSNPIETCYNWYLKTIMYEN